MASESSVQKTIWGGLGALSRLFRLNGGKGWISGLGPKGILDLADGSKLIKAPRPIALGFATPSGDSIPGQSDLGGWTKVLVTPEMVGQHVAVVTFIETKKTKGGKASETQINFVNQVNEQGGIAGIANSIEAAREIFAQWAKKKGAKL